MSPQTYWLVVTLVGIGLATSFMIWLWFGAIGQPPSQEQVCRDLYGGLLAGRGTRDNPLTMDDLLRAIEASKQPSAMECPPPFVEA